MALALKIVNQPNDFPRPDSELRDDYSEEVDIYNIYFDDRCQEVETHLAIPTQSVDACRKGEGGEGEDKMKAFGEPGSTERNWLRLPVVSLAAEYLVIGYLMRHNILAYKAPPNNEG
jgi:hypothetical protein